MSDKSSWNYTIRRFAIFIVIKLLAMWRKAAGEFAGAERTNLWKRRGRARRGKAIEFKLLAPADDVGQLIAATESVKQRLERLYRCLRHRRRQYAPESGNISFV